MAKNPPSQPPARPPAGRRDDPAEQWRHHRRAVRAGQALMLIGGLVVIVHVVAHLAGSPSGWVDLAAGYPTGGLIFLAGVVTAGRAEPKARRR